MTEFYHPFKSVNITLFFVIEIHFVVSMLCVLYLNQVDPVQYAYLMNSLNNIVGFMAVIVIGLVLDIIIRLIISIYKWHKDRR